MKRFVACVLGCLAVAAVGAAARAPRVAAQRIVYIGTYTGETSKGIYAFRFDDGSGELTPIGLVAETPSPSFLIASADGRFVYAVNELQTFGGAASGSVTAFAVDRTTGKLTELNAQPTEGTGPCHLALDRTGRYLAVANYGGGNFAILPVGTDGRLQKAVTVVTGQNAETGTAKPLGHMVAFDATNKFLITADKGLNRMLVFHFDATTGKVTPNTPPSAPLPPGSGPRHFAMHTNGEWLFTIAEQAATITTFKWDGKTGSLSATSSVPTRPAGSDERIDRRDCPASQREVRLRLQSRTRQHRCFQHWRRGRAEPRRIRADARSDAAQLCHRPDRPLADCREPAVRHPRRVHHRSEHRRADAVRPVVASGRTRVRAVHVGRCVHAACDSLWGAGFRLRANAPARLAEALAKAVSPRRRRGA